MGTVIPKLRYVTHSLNERVNVSNTALAAVFIASALQTANGQIGDG
jgi:hypothetical protein